MACDGTGDNEVEDVGGKHVFGAEKAEAVDGGTGELFLAHALRFIGEGCYLWWRNIASLCILIFNAIN